MTPYLIESIGLIATVGAIVGVCLNNNRRRSCFIVWAFTNAASLGIHAAVGVWSLAARDAAFLVLAWHGWVKWGKP
jgi:nicotinamide riboside transporter PnuC